MSGKRSSYREILILVAGATPQIITETIYTLSQKHPPVYPDGVFIITTTTIFHNYKSQKIRRHEIRSQGREGEDQD